MKKHSIRITTPNGEHFGMIRGRFLPDCPKTYKELYVRSGNEFKNPYGTNIFTVFKARDGSLRYEKYIDGNFYPMYGKLIKLEGGI